MVRAVWPLLLGLIVIAWPAQGGEEKPLAKVVNLDKVNSDADEDDPFVLGDNLWYASNKAGTFDLYMAKRSGQNWLAGKMFLGEKDADERSPFFYAKTLYFASNAIPDETLKDLKNFDIKAKVGDRQPLPLPGISEKEDELHPWVAAGGKEFYFSRKTDKGWKLFVATGPANPPIGKAQEVGFPEGFHHATVSASGLVMYLQGPLAKDRWGIFRAKRNKLGGKWTMPEPVIALNHEGGKRGDMSPCLNTESTWLYFVSDRPGGKGGLDIWVAATKDLK